MVCPQELLHTVPVEDMPWWRVRNMKKTLPKGKKTELATGARMAYGKHKVHLRGQLEKFFAEFNGGQSTYTPRTV